MLSGEIRVLTFAVLLSALCGCENPQEVEGCLGDVELSVLSGNSPSFTWAPECGISNLAVLDGAGQVMWGIHGPVGENAIVPPVRFGVSPDGATQSAPPQELRVGEGYVVRVFRLHRTSGGELQLIRNGEAHFRPGS